MFVTCRIHLPESGKQPAQPDGGKTGYLLVIYKGEPRWAKPCYQMGSFTPPTDLWVRKNAEKLAVIVGCERTELEEENEDHLIYFGFTPLEETLPQDVEDAFPEKQLHASSRWEVITSESETDPHIEIRYTGDPDDPKAPAAPGATVFKISQKPGNESVELTQVVDGQPSGTKFAMNPDGSLSITVKGGSSYSLEKTKAETKLDGGTGFKVEGKDASATFTLGSGGFHGVIYEELLTFMGQLKVWLATHIHPTPSGPSSPVLPATPPPDFPTSAKADKLKIPK